MQSEVVTLHNIAKGAVIEKFERAMDEVMANIRDVNTDAKKKRKITVTVDLNPYADRSGAEVTVNVDAKTAALNAIKSSLFIAVQGGEVKAFTKDIRQQELPLEPSNVVSMVSNA